MIQSPCSPEKWITIQRNLGLAHNTISAYTRALNEFFCFCDNNQFEPSNVTREQVALYVNHLLTKPVISYNLKPQRQGLSNATIQQKITVIRLYYDFLMEEGVKSNNPVGRGCYKSGRLSNVLRGLLPHYKVLPWVPNESEWSNILEAVKTESLRNKLMLAMAYDAGLRREELCSLQISDINPAHKTLHIRAEVTKSRRARVVPYSSTTSQLLVTYLHHRNLLANNNRSTLFLSESRRNHGQPITLWTWSKAVRAIAKKSGVLKLSTHTFRHLCLTDLARSGWELHEIATFAGHRNINTTMLYIHLSGRELTEKLEKATTLHNTRMMQTFEVIHHDANE